MIAPISPGQIQFLKLFNSLDRDLATTQKQISSGLKISEPADNPSYWRISSGIAFSLSTSSAIDQAASTLSVQFKSADDSLSQVRKTLAKMSDHLIRASAPGADRVGLVAEFEKLRSSLSTIVKMANAGQQNILENASTTVPKQVRYELVAGLRLDSDNQASAETIAFDVTSIAMVDLFNPERGLLTKAYNAAGLRNDTPPSLTATGFIEERYYVLVETDYGSRTAPEPLDFRRVQRKLPYAAPPMGDEPARGSPERAAWRAQQADYNRFQRIYPRYEAHIAKNQLEFDAYTTYWANQPASAAQAAGATDQGGSPDIIQGRSAALNKDSTDADLKDVLAVVNRVRSDVIDAQADLGRMAKRLESYQDAHKKSQDLNELNLGQMIDADISEASARLRSLQTRQSLAIEMLSIANANQKLILDLLK